MILTLQAAWDERNEMMVKAEAKINEASKLMAESYDLGGDDTSIPVVKYIEEMAYEKSTHKIKWRVHSANPVGRKNIKDGMNSAERFWKKQTGEEDEVN
jgi:hypothetical protein